MDNRPAGLMGSLWGLLASPPITVNVRHVANIPVWVTNPDRNEWTQIKCMTDS